MASQIRVLLGRNVCRLRNQLGLTQEQLAERLGIDRSYVPRIEAGKARPGPELMVGLPLALGASYDELFAVVPGNLNVWRRMSGRDEGL